jgi:hypothetical protein
VKNDCKSQRDISIIVKTGEVRRSKQKAGEEYSDRHGDLLGGGQIQRETITSSGKANDIVQEAARAAATPYSSS